MHNNNVVIFKRSDFMNFKKILLKLSLLLLCIVPINTLAYSSKVIPGGENIGIHVALQKISIVGFYKVEDRYIGEEAGFKIGDQIEAINQNPVTTIDEMVKEIQDSSESIDIKVSRNGEERTETLKLVKDENNVIKTGLYVKDKITGIGTLSYIDPETKIFGALGHEILDKNTSQKVEIKDGSIFKSEVVGITPSENGKPGEKNAKFYSNISYGTISKNEEEGVFGKYVENFDESDAIEVGDLEDVQLGKAYLRTVINGSEKQDFEIKILEVDENNDTKNILFEITDEKLLEKTGGVVAGMSGSPIIQNGKLIAACTHVVVNSPHKGFAISIEKMLEEGER